MTTLSKFNNFKEFVYNIKHLYMYMLLDSSTPTCEIALKMWKLRLYISKPPWVHQIEKSSSRCTQSDQFPTILNSG